MIQTLLDARDLYRFYRAGDDEVLALRGVSVSIAPGEVVAVVGPSGSGKSTLMSCLAGLDEPSGGTVRVAGQRLSHRPERERASIRARSIGVVFQTSNLFGHLTVAQNVTMAQTLVRRRARTRTTQVGELLESLGLTRRDGALPSELSGGETARAALAVALANDPDVVLADEPTGELDSTTESRVLGLLTGLASRGRGVLVVTHSMAVTKIADTVIRLHDGSVVP